MKFFCANSVAARSYYLLIALFLRVQQKGWGKAHCCAYLLGNFLLIGSPVQSSINTYFTPVSVKGAGWIRSCFWVHMNFAWDGISISTTSFCQVGVVVTFCEKFVGFHPGK